MRRTLTVALGLLAAGPAWAGWTQTEAKDGCTFFKGTAEGEVLPVRAECDWAVSPQKLQDLLAKSGDHDKYFSGVAESTVKAKTANGADLAYQRHVASGISDREAMIIMGSEDISGGKRFTWTLAPDQSGVTGEHVLIAFDTGKWEITANPDGTAHVVYELRYLAGGSVPGFLVRWFQGAGMQQLVFELQAAAK